MTKDLMISQLQKLAAESVLDFQPFAEELRDLHTEMSKLFVWQDKTIWQFDVEVDRVLSDVTRSNAVLRLGNYSASVCLVNGGRSVIWQSMHRSGSIHCRSIEDLRTFMGFMLEDQTFREIVQSHREQK